MVSPVRRAICRDPLYSGLLTSVTSHLQEKRIYDLKKKNQELEKFKFVLDYKIKELKKQIEPREKEIKVMKEQIQEVRSHLPRPAVPSQLPPTSWPGVKEPPHSPSLLPRRVQPPFCRGCHGEGPARGLVVQKQIALGFGLPRPAGGLRPYQHHLKVHTLGPQRETAAVGLSATRGRCVSSHQRASSESSPLPFNILPLAGNVVWCPVQDRGVCTSYNKEWEVIRDP